MIWFALAGLALAQDPSTFEADTEVVTLDEAPIGSETPFSVRFTHTGGDAVAVSSLDLTNFEGTGFTFAGSSELEIPDGGSATLELVFRPTSPGIHMAELTVNSDADCALGAKVLLRGVAYRPCMVATPAVLDFGPMSPPDSDVYLVMLTSCDGRTHTVDTSFMSNPRFTMAAPPSFEVGPGGQTVTVQYTPIDDSAQSAELLLGTWDTRMQMVASDCYAGNPANYDSDGDGVSDCGIGVGGFWEDGDGDGFSGADGDCDDSDPAIYPAAPEVDGGRDDNCDGQVDEHRDGDFDGIPATQDCDDANPWVGVGTDEVFDGLDNDCDGEVDDGVEPATCGTEGDGDGAGSGGCGCAGAPGPAGAGWVVGLGLLGLRRRR